MGKIIEFRPRQEEHKEEFSEELKALEWWILEASRCMGKVASGKYTKMDMIECMCALTGLHNHVSKQLHSLEVYKVRKEAAERKVN